jgi:hypothetical protein
MGPGIKTIVFPVEDLAGAKALFRNLLGVEPYADEPYYVGSSTPARRRSNRSRTSAGAGCRPSRATRTATSSGSSRHTDRSGLTGSSFACFCGRM